MRQLLPVPVDPVDPAAVYVDGEGARGLPFVRLNMIASADGATALQGVSGGLGADADRRVFRALRSLADVVLVAAGTARAEDYGPAVLDEPLRAGRAARGQAPVPTIAVVTRSCDLDWAGRLFADPARRPVVVTVADAPADRRLRATAVADVVMAGHGDVDLPAALRELAARGARSVLAEGGPTLNAQLVGADLVDEICLTISPLLAGGDSKRIVAGPPVVPPARLSLASLCEDDGLLFLRWRVLRD